MSQATQSKAVTQNIVITEPEAEHLDKQLLDRLLSPELLQFLRSVVRSKNRPAGGPTCK